MDFTDDPRREKIEPLHEYMMMWARWGRNHPKHYESNTLVIMRWLEDHAKEAKEIEEGIVRGEPIVIHDESQEFIARRVEYLLTRPYVWWGHESERKILVRYYRDAKNGMPVGKIARRLLGCKPWEIEETVKKALLFFSYWWSYDFKWKN